MNIFFSVINITVSLIINDHVLKNLNFGQKQRNLLRQSFFWSNGKLEFWSNFQHQV